MPLPALPAARKPLTAHTLHSYVPASQPPPHLQFMQPLALHVQAKHEHDAVHLACPLHAFLYTYLAASGSPQVPAQGHGSAGGAPSSLHAPGSLMRMASQAADRGRAGSEGAATAAAQPTGEGEARCAANPSHHRVTQQVGPNYTLLWHCRTPTQPAASPQLPDFVQSSGFAHS